MKPKKEAVDRLSEIIRLYGQCLDLTRRLLEEDSWQKNQGQALTAIHRRGEILTRIRSLDREMEPIYVELGVLKEGPEWDWSVLNREGKLRSQVDRLMAAVSDLDKADRELQDKMSDALEETGEQLERFRKGRTALKAYLPFQKSRPKYFSRKS